MEAERNHRGERYNAPEDFGIRIGPENRPIVIGGDGVQVREPRWRREGEGAPKISARIAGEKAGPRSYVREGEHQLHKGDEEREGEKRKAGIASPGKAAPEVESAGDEEKRGLFKASPEAALRLRKLNIISRRDAPEGEE